ncbi:M14 family zinc carboxypeptidase [Neolewinella persica]|uniref:M14 family zinc carboxypeptidase n=1 Tax=Neolewinella persica TaxID=70998 RepID=UPI0003757438|nr:M14 family zinc carboxypeptidase [Neolewinella persica]
MKWFFLILILAPFWGTAQPAAPANYGQAVVTTKLVPEDAYPSYPDYVGMMHQLADQYPDRCVLENWGDLPSGRQILALRITDNVPTATGRPQVLFTAAMHGDETAGYWLLLRLAEHLLTEETTGLLAHVEVFINPMANPDGAFRRSDSSLDGATRGNAAGVDLNRNYPDPDDGPHPDGFDYQPETNIFIKAAREHSFDLSLNLHGGAEVFNYPWDTYRNRHPDTEWWRRISRDFASRAQTASLRDNYFQDRHNGITNGHDWYPISGSRQDYMNYYHRCREATLEVSNRKQFPAARLPELWRFVSPAIMGYLSEARYGLHGFARDRDSGRPIGAQVSVPGHDKDNSDIFASSNYGNFHRYLAEGEYQILFSAPGYVPQWRNVAIKDGKRTDIMVEMERLEVSRKR